MNSSRIHRLQQWCRTTLLGQEGVIVGTHLLTNPQPPVTRYNQVALWAAISFIVLIVVGYSWVLSTHPQHTRSPLKEPLVTLSTPLVTATPTPPPPPAAVPDAPKEQPVTWRPEPEVPAVAAPPPPTPPPVSQQAIQPNPLDELRKKEREQGLRSPLLVAAFNPDKASAQPGSTPHANALSPDIHPGRYPQALEIAPTTHQGPAPLSLGASFGQEQTGGGVRGFGQPSQYLTAQLQPPRSPYQVNAGSQLPVVLAQDVTSDVQSFFSAIVTRDVYDSISSRFLLVPAGSRITFLTDMDERTNEQPLLMLSAKTLYLPNGYSIALQGMPGANGFGMAGLTDQVNRHFFQRYGSAAVLSLVVAGIRMATYSHGSGGFAYSPQDAAMNGVGSVFGNTVGEDLRQKLAIKPTVVIRAGYPFNVTVTQDMVFPAPYGQAVVARGYGE